MYLSQGPLIPLKLCYLSIYAFGGNKNESVQILKDNPKKIRNSKITLAFFKDKEKEGLCKFSNFIRVKKLRKEVLST
jgi:hypothetical protein